MKISKGYFGTAIELTNDDLRALAQGTDLTSGDITLRAPPTIQHDSGDEDDLPLFGMFLER